MARAGFLLMPVLVYAEGPEDPDIRHTHHRQDQSQRKADHHRKKGKQDCYKNSLQEQLLIFFIYTYFCGAVYDNYIYIVIP